MSPNGTEMTEITFRFAPGSPRFQMPLDEKIVIARDGREHFARSWSASMFGGNVLTFAVPRGQATALTHRSRARTRSVKSATCRCAPA